MQAAPPENSASPQANPPGGAQVTIEEIIASAKGYMPEENLALLKKAHAFAEEFYSGKHRISGMPFIQHALMVTGILAGMRLDVPTLCAGLLHGVIKQAENLKETEKKLKAEFGGDVLNIVKGATRITDVQFNSRLAWQAENTRKLLLAMSSDIRVLLVKLADRFHDMQSLRFVSQEKQLEYARETMELYAPLAGRLGIDWLKRELEDLAFSYLEPEAYQAIADKLQSSLADREAYVEEVKALLAEKLKEHGLDNFEILGRPKHIHSIHRKLLAQGIPFEKVYDKVAFRIILGTVKECYEAMGIIHSLWPPIDGRFKDFISTPKSNGYQSLHTSVVGVRGEFMEIQLRTAEMDQVAKEGIAAHWAYKEGKAVTSRDVKLFKWLKQLVQTMQELEDPKEFLDAVRGELYGEEIFVLTPTGEVREFPKGSTPIDFAYGIHTEVGNRCSGAKINGLIAPLKTQLKNGDRVEVITSPRQKPSRSWLTLVKTARAKSRIRQWLNQEEREKNLALGQDICDRELKRHNLNLKKLIKTGHIKELLKNLACNSLDDLMRRVGSGKLAVQTVVNELQPPEIREEKAEELGPEITPLKKRKRQDKGSIILVRGSDNILTKISNCCLPVPGDEIAGFITAGRGITVHKASCPNLAAADPERLIEVAWAEGIKASHRAQIVVIARDRKGFLAALSNAISHDDANIISLEAAASSGGMARIVIVAEVDGREHLMLLLQHLQQLDGVLEARRA